MDVFRAIRYMMNRRGLTIRRLSTMLGREESYMGGILYKRRVPSANILTRIADLCSYDLVLKSRTGNDEITLSVDDD